MMDLDDSDRESLICGGLHAVANDTDPYAEVLENDAPYQPTGVPTCVTRLENQFHQAGDQTSDEETSGDENASIQTEKSLLSLPSTVAVTPSPLKQKSKKRSRREREQELETIGEEETMSHETSESQPKKRKLEPPTHDFTPPASISPTKSVVPQNESTMAMDVDQKSGLNGQCVMNCYMSMCSVLNDRWDQAFFFKHGIGRVEIA